MKSKHILALAFVSCLLISTLILCFCLDVTPEIIALKVRPGMSFEKVTEYLGPPDLWVTSSYRIAHYDMNDGRILVVTYSVKETGEILVESRELKER